MRLRELENKDAEYMLEWMHDENVCTYLGKDFKHMTIDDCRNFIRQSREDHENKHYAIVDDGDEYMGTISMKNLDCKQGRAEYAISCRSKAMGKGYAKMATEELFRIAQEQYGLKMLYLDVYDYNVRAQKLYLKTGFEQIEKPAFIQEETDPRLLWFQKKFV